MVGKKRLPSGNAFWAVVWLLLATMLTRAVVAAEPPKLRKWQVDGVTREALVAAPRQAKEKSSPVIFVFHGHGGTMRHAAQTFALHELWPEATCVYMQGLNTPGQLTDPEGKKSGWQHAAGELEDRDLKFFDTVLASLQEKSSVDPQRVFATGHSNGGGFTYLLLSQRSQQLAAVAPSAAAALRIGTVSKPRPVLHIAGRRDQVVKYSWQVGTINRMLKLNNCADKPSKWADGLCDFYPSESDSPVVAFVHDGDHAFPPAAPAVIVKFFQNYDQLKPDP